MTGWGKEWPVAPVITSEGKALPDDWANSKAWEEAVNKDFDKVFRQTHTEAAPISEEAWNKLKDKTPWIGIDYGSEPSKTVTGIFVDGKLEKVYNNLSPTHDPYTNPNAIIYYQCNCGAILDCNTKSFAALNNHASKMDWKIRWGVTSYQPYCVNCGKEVE